MLRPMEESHVHCDVPDGVAAPGGPCRGGAWACLLLKFSAHGRSAFVGLIKRDFRTGKVPSTGSGEADAGPCTRMSRPRWTAGGTFHPECHLTCAGA